MAERQPPSAAQSIFPNLPSGTPPVVERRTTADIASAMYAHLKPSPPAPMPNPKRQRSLEEIRDWSGIPVSYARSVGFVPIEPGRIVPTKPGRLR